MSQLIMVIEVQRPIEKGDLEKVRRKALSHVGPNVRVVVLGPGVTCKFAEIPDGLEKAG